MFSNLVFFFLLMWQFRSMKLILLYSLDTDKPHQQFHWACPRPFLYPHHPIALPRLRWLYCCNSKRIHFSRDYVLKSHLCSSNRWSRHSGSYRTLRWTEMTETSDNFLNTVGARNFFCKILLEKSAKSYAKSGARSVDNTESFSPLSGNFSTVSEHVSTIISMFSFPFFQSQSILFDSIKIWGNFMKIKTFY